MSAEATKNPRQILSNRHRVLELLLEEAHSRPELVDSLGCSRSTVDRAVEELLAIDCIERTAPNGSQYRGTSLGELMLQTHQEYLDELQHLEEVRPILAELPSEAPLSEQIIRDADVYRSVHSPDVAFRPGQELLQDATKMVGTAPVVYREYFEEFIDRLNQAPLEFEVLMEPSVVETIIQHYQDEFETLTEFDSVRVYQSDRTLPYGLWFMELPSSTAAGITFYNEGGVPGAIVNDSDEAVEWAIEQYNQFKEGATEIA